MKRYYSIVITIIVIGLFLFLVQAKWCDPNGFWYSATGNIASAILICSIISLLDHIIRKNEEDKRLADLFGISLSIKESGLKNILIDSADYHYHDLIVKAERFAVIINDGRRWVGNHSNALEKRFDKNGTITEFFLVNPDSDFCKALNLKTYVDGQDTPDVKISHTISLLRSTYEKSHKLGELKIYYLKNYPTQTLFYTEDTVIVTPYQTSSGRAIIPLYEYHYDPSVKSIASHLHEDLIRVRQESTLVFDSSK